MSDAPWHEDLLGLAVMAPAPPLPPPFAGSHGTGPAERSTFDARRYASPAKRAGSTKVSARESIEVIHAPPACPRDRRRGSAPAPARPSSAPGAGQDDHWRKRVVGDQMQCAGTAAPTLQTAASGRTRASLPHNRARLPEPMSASQVEPIVRCNVALPQACRTRHYETPAA